MTMVPIRILIGGMILEAELFDTETANAIRRSLPIEATPQEWGDEFYFPIPVRLPLDETATSEVTAGDIGYWPPGHALAIFFGPTPMSTGPDPVPASDVNLVGKVKGDPTILRKAKGAAMIRIERCD